MITPEELAMIAEATAGSIRTAMAKLEEKLAAEYERKLREHIAQLPAGPKGEKGDPGESIRGEKGEPGERGEKGDSIIGAPGKDADPVDVDALILRVAELVPKPENGKDGAPGRDGIDGKDGERGKDGKDAPPVDVKAIEEAVLSRIPKPQDGRDADPEMVRQLVSTEVQRVVSGLPAPKDGEPGAPGKDGTSVHPDSVALMVREAVDAVVAKIPKPEPGRDGEPGRDALQLDPLSSLDPLKSYPRGTVGLHQGGTLRANRTTTPGPELSLPEWDVLMDGVAWVEAAHSADFRTVSLDIFRTSGKRDHYEFAFPVVIDRGIYKASESYFRGDSVGHDGSSWIAQVDLPKEKPGVNGEWRLSGKRGRDGKDLRPPEPLKPQEPVRLK